MTKEVLTKGRGGEPDDETKATLREAAQALILRLPFLTGAHALAFAATLWRAIEGGGSPVAPVLLAALVLIDGGIWAMLGRLRVERLRPQAVIRAALVYCALSSALLAVSAATAADPVVEVAAYAGLFVSALAFISAPAAVIVVGTGAVAAAILQPLAWPLVAMIAGMAALLWSYSLGQRRLIRDLVQRAASKPIRLPEPGARTGKPESLPQDGHADRFVAEFEQSGRGWFWETAPDGRLTYISAPLARQLGQSVEALIGRALVDLISDEDGGDDRLRSERTLAFYLSVRMVFNEVTVRAIAPAEIWWSMSGRPIFDAQGAFLGFRGLGSDLSEKKRAEAEVRRLARHDSLTGLPNRDSMMRTLEEALRTGVAGRAPCALFMLDLDRFKAVNDSQGHLVGDELLKLVGKRLREVVGKVGQVGRLGGDEFKIVVPRADDSEMLADLARKCISYVSIPYRINGRTFSIGASIGIAIAEPGQTDADALIRRADLALYAAKASSRGSHRFFEPEMQTVAQDRQALEHDLREALAEGLLEIHYQPVVHSATEMLAGFEALLRWRHPVQGYVSPTIFVPIAEESGLIVQIGEWVIRAACADAARMPPGIRIAVNLSPVQFANPNLPNVIVSALAAAQLPASRLELEITEGVFLSQDPRTDEIFARLKSLGVRLALDDFGTGYSSLGYLRTAPFDKIKIDQSFVRGATIPGSRNRSILRAIVDLAEGLGMDTTAEGAETYDELELIRNLGCSHVQGYIFGRAMVAEDARRLAAQNNVVARSGFATARQIRQRMIRKGVIHHDQGTMPAIIRNISEGGALVEGKRGFPPGSMVRLEIVGAGLLEAEVRWSQDDRIGLRFTREFDVGTLGTVRADPAAARPMMTPDYIASGDYLKAAPDEPLSGAM